MKLFDEDGNWLPELDPNSDLVKIIFLAEWARKRGFTIGPYVQIGNVTLQIKDLRQFADSNHSEPEVDVWAAHGHQEP